VSAFLEDAHLGVWEAEQHETSAARSWYRWYRRAVALVGHDLDGDQSEDGYSLDGAYEAWRQGVSPEAHARAVNPAPSAVPAGAASATEAVAP
jgi:hypothetical protein